MSRTITRITKVNEAELNMLKKRIDIATATVIFMVIVIIVRLWFLQINQGVEYTKLSENNRIRAHKTIAPRGNILDRNGKIMTTNRPSFNIVWVREDAPNPDRVIKQLAKILDMDIATLLDLIRSGSDYPRHMPILLKRDIDWERLVYIENHYYQLPGVRLEVLPTRDYLTGNLASHLVGYLGEINQKELRSRERKDYDRGDLIGKSGIEKEYESYLRGDKGRSYVEVDVHGFQQKRLDVLEPFPGHDVQLTIDLDLQETAEKAMDEKAGAAIVMEVNTGRLLVLASDPPLPLSEFIGGISRDLWQSMLENPLHPLINKTINGQYPPGSTYKIITAMAALSEGAITPDTVINCNGSYRFQNRTYHCWKEKGHGPVNLKKALTESCDVYFYQAGQSVGVDQLARYAQGFGLGKKTGIQLDNEKTGLTPTVAWKEQKYREPWQKGETLSTAIGQGFNLVTPLQLCRMTAATANGGTLYKPQFIENVIDIDGNIITTFTPVQNGKIIASEESLKLVQEGLVAAVNDQHGTGQAARLKDITVAGKTGTAQVVHLSQNENLADDEIPYEYRDHAWFTCYAPAEAPEIAVTVLLEHGGHGGSAAAPIARKLLQKYFDLKKQRTPITATTADRNP
jgi:penicillin-binding protein 2